MIYCINCINVRSFNMTINLCYPFAHLIVGVIFKADCRTPTRSDHEVRLSRPRPRPRHLAQRLKAAHLTVPRPQTHTFSENS